MVDFNENKFEYKGNIADVKNNFIKLDEKNVQISEEVLSKHCQKILQLMESGISGAQIIDLVDFKLEEIDKKTDSSQGIFLATHPDMADEIENLFNGEISFLNKYSKIKSKYQVVFNLKSHNGFTLEMNSGIFESIKNHEVVKYLKYGNLNIPFIVKAGNFIKIYYMRLSSHHINEIADAKFEQSSLLNIKPHKTISFLGEIENENYIYSRTRFDLIEVSNDIIEKLRSRVPKRH